MQNDTKPSPFDGSVYARQIEAYWDQTVRWVLANGLEILVAVAIGAVIVAAMLGIRHLALRFCRSRFHAHWPRIIASAAIRTHILFMVAVAARLVGGYADPPAAVERTIEFFFTIAATLQVTMWVREVVLGTVEHRASGMTNHSNLGSAIGLIRLMVTIVLFAVATLMILDNLGVNVTGLIAGLGIGGIAIGLAAKGIFDDLFSALSIIFDRPFSVGDTIKFGSTIGTVEAIGLKTTRVRATTGEEVVVSNTNLLDKELHNLNRLERRRQTLAIGVTYQTSPEKCEEAVRLIREVVEREHCTVVVCAMKDFGASSIDFDVQFDIPDALGSPPVVKHRVVLGILKAFNDARIDFAYPTQVTFTAAPDGSMVMPYAEGHDGEGHAPPAARVKVEE
ncbi:mechanosensitive ion channel family protein [Sphingomonas sp. ID0503]|uniref:mechanosensitive ion channel family protein n=1 Tax=Sphingomonas sp. ID0503 TaxID=3399691 RepID=UPI003AFB574B